MRHDDRRLKIKLILQTVHGRRQRQLNAIKSTQRRSATINAVIISALNAGRMFIAAQICRSSAQSAHTFDTSSQ